MKFRIHQIAALIQADVEGDAEREIHGLGKIEDARDGELTFLGNPKYAGFVASTQASAIIVRTDFVPPTDLRATLLRVEDPYEAFRQLLEVAAEAIAKPTPGIHPQACIDPSAKIGAEVYIGPFVYVGPHAEIGDGAQLHPHTFVGPMAKVGAQSILHARVTVYHHCHIGNQCVIHAGAVIGSDGFGFAPQADGSFKKIPQTGNVVIEDQVEIGANSCIDRATLGSTLIQKGAKLDNLIQIAHNVSIGPSTAIAAQAGIAGSTTIGAGCLIGGQAGIVGHVQIASLTKIDAQSGVNRSIKDSGQAFRGSPIQPHRQQLKSEALFRRLEQMSRKIHHLEQQIKQHQKED
ncbi:MAG: UDP-3-O-(3-hydroxymyristoyl)glucosamine N-acyltransferase [Bacteroidota bacterium]